MKPAPPVTTARSSISCLWSLTPRWKETRHQPCRSPSATAVELLLRSGGDGPIQASLGDPARESLLCDEVGVAISARLPMTLDLFPIDVDIREIAIAEGLPQGGDILALRELLDGLVVEHCVV